MAKPLQAVGFETETWTSRSSKQH